MKHVLGTRYFSECLTVGSFCFQVQLLRLYNERLLVDLKLVGLGNSTMIVKSNDTL